MGGGGEGGWGRRRGRGKGGVTGPDGVGAGGQLQDVQQGTVQHTLPQLQRLGDNSINGECFISVSRKRVGRMGGGWGKGMRGEEERERGWGGGGSLALTGLVLEDSRRPSNTHCHSGRT